MGTTTLVSINSTGTASGNGSSYFPAISAGGNVVAFESVATNLDPLDTSPTKDVYARNFTKNTIYLVSVNSAGTGGGNGTSYNPAISADGNMVAFRSYATNLSPLDTNVTQDIFARNVTTNTTYLVSVSWAGIGGGNKTSSNQVISADGSTVAFSSDASNLVSGDYNRRKDAFVYSVASKTTQIVSGVATGLASITVGGVGGSISADGRYVAFASAAPNLVSGIAVSPGVWNVYRYDRVTGQIELVSIDSAGTGSGNAASGGAVISADGNVVAFESFATNLSPLDTNSTEDVYARNLTSNTTYLVSINSAGTGGGNGDSVLNVISPDGSVVVFDSTATNLSSLDTSSIQDIYARNLTTNTTYLVSVDSSETAGGNGHSYAPVISSDGSVVAFNSYASNLSPLDTNNTGDVFARNLTTGTTYLVSVNAADTASGNVTSVGCAISADGNVVAFSSSATNLSPMDAGIQADVYARNLALGTTTLVSVNSAGTASGNSYSNSPTVSADGSVVAFVSEATDLSPLDMNSNRDVYARNLSTGTTYLVSVNSAGTNGGNGDSEFPLISADGSVVAFVSEATDLSPSDTNSNRDIYARNLTTSTTYLVSVNSAGTDGGNDWSGSTAISANGGVVAFESNASDLVDADYDQQSDVFVAAIGRPNSVPGDYNLDGAVDAADYVVWRKTLGQMGVIPYSGADGNGDGDITADDYGVWRTQFGETLATSGAGSNAATTIRTASSSSLNSALTGF